MMPHHLKKNAEFMLSFYEELIEKNSKDEIYYVLKKISSRFSFEYFYILNIPEVTSNRIGNSFIIGNWPEELIKEYDYKSVLTHSPIISGLRASHDPLKWTLQDVQQTFPTCTAEDVVSMFDRFQMRMGICFPSFDAEGRAGAVCFAGDRSMPEDGELAALHLMSHFLFGHLCGLIQDMPSGAPRLTNRERECIAWASEGKTISETAQIIGISQTTVNGYLVSAMRKLNVMNKAHLVAKAIRCGAIH